MVRQDHLNVPQIAASWIIWICHSIKFLCQLLVYTQHRRHSYGETDRTKQFLHTLIKNPFRRDFPCGTFRRSLERHFRKTTILVVQCHKSREKMNSLRQVFSLLF